MVQPQIGIEAIEIDESKDKSKSPDQQANLQIGTESEPSTIPDTEQEEKKRSESEPIVMMQDIDKKDEKEEKKTVSIQSPDDNGSDGSESTRETDTSSDVSINPAYIDNKGWLTNLNYASTNQVNYVLKMISAYAKVILGKNRRVHLSWKRGVMLAIGLEPSQIKELEIKQENIREGDPISIDNVNMY